MVSFKKRVSTCSPRFHNRHVAMVFGDESKVDEISWFGVEDDEVICNGCNVNVYSDKEETFGWLIYLDRDALKNDEPYDFYCDDCVEKLWEKAVEVR